MPTNEIIVVSNRPYSYSQYWTGTSLQWRLMWGISLKRNKCHLHLERLPALALDAS